jgi:hypothetical protein
MPVKNSDFVHLSKQFRLPPLLLYALSLELILRAKNELITFKLLQYSQLKNPQSVCKSRAEIPNVEPASISHCFRLEQVLLQQDCSKI